MPRRFLQPALLGRSAVIGHIRIRAPARIRQAFGRVVGKVDKAPLVLRLDPVGRPVEEDDGLVAPVGGVELGPQSRGLACVHDDEVHAEGLNPLVVVLAPVDGTAEVAPLGGGFRCRELACAGMQCLPVGKAGTSFLHIVRVPPFLPRDCVVRTGIEQVAGPDELLEVGLVRALPYLDLHVQVAVGHPRELKLVVGRYEFHVVAELLQQLARDVGEHNLARPVVEHYLDGIARFGRISTSGHPGSGQPQQQRRATPGDHTAGTESIGHVHSS